ncbi:ATP-binding protein [Halorientalis salina]|uniref:ATP-binding protein n=1 Tax=Halorientalis salina TaxID=2932266 RepID=UPI0010AB622C|nr:ATP-binding protein [Halorientalis salina]
MRVIGREASDGPRGRLGWYRARDGSPGENVAVDLDGPHVGTIVGKRGSGKSYTMGVLAEELARTDGIAPVVADPMGVFGTLAERGRDVRARVVDPQVPASALDPGAWCRLLDLDPAEGAGTLVWQAAELAETLDGMHSFVTDAEATETNRRAAANHLRLADSWGVFGANGDDEGMDLTGDAVTVLDLSGLGRAPMNAALSAVARALYDARVAGSTDRLPWLLVDEAHAFFGGIAEPALRTLLTRGRQPGVSLVTATQRPSALPDVAISQTDLLVVHRLASRADREALAATRPAYMSETLAERMPTDPGEAVVIDDATESVHTVQIRERDTPHGGGSPAVSDGFRR